MLVLDLNSLLSSVIGGMGVLLLSIAYGRCEVKKKRDQELKGLITLVFHEYGNNDYLLKWLSENPSFIHAPSFTNLPTGVWAESRARLSQLLAKDHTGALAIYYSYIETIRDTIRDDSMPEDVKTDAVLGHIERAEKYGKAAMLPCCMPPSTYSWTILPTRRRATTGSSPKPGG